MQGQEEGGGSALKRTRRAAGRPRPVPCPTSAASLRQSTPMSAWTLRMAAPSWLFSARTSPRGFLRVAHAVDGDWRIDRDRRRSAAPKAKVSVARIIARGLMSGVGLIPSSSHKSRTGGMPAGMTNHAWSDEQPQRSGRRGTLGAGRH